MEPSSLLAAHLGRKAAPYLWHAVGWASAGIAAVTVTVLVMVAGATSGIGVLDSSRGTGCGVAGLDRPGNPSRVDVPGVRLDAEQLANATVISATGRRLGMSVRGLVVALAAALQESGLRNLDYGHADSVGLFQQRPSQGWGEVAQLLQPDYAAGKFYEALVQVPGWESLPVSEAAQAVQRSAFPTAYGRWEAAAMALVSDSTVGAAVCADPGPAGSAFSDGLAVGVPVEKPNPRSVVAAIQWAQQEAASGAGGWYRQCLAFVAQAYGWAFSGTQYAVDQYTAVMPTHLRHDGDRNPVPGALLFWSTSSRAGHVALYLGGDLIASNDIVTPGEISVVPASDIESKWGARYLGWAPPYFPGGG